MNLTKFIKKIKKTFNSIRIHKIIILISNIKIHHKILKINVNKIKNNNYSQ
jgi:hypothetical protein